MSQTTTNFVSEIRTGNFETNTTVTSVELKTNEASELSASTQSMTTYKLITTPTADVITMNPSIASWTVTEITSGTVTKDTTLDSTRITTGMPMTAENTAMKTTLTSIITTNALEEISASFTIHTDIPLATVTVQPAVDSLTPKAVSTSVDTWSDISTATTEAAAAAAAGSGTATVRAAEPTDAG